MPLYAIHVLNHLHLRFRSVFMVSFLPPVEVIPYDDLAKWGTDEWRLCRITTATPERV
jgi:hypothetical protein